jgi:hypothetical protein
MEVVYPLSEIESSESLVKVTFIAKEPGYYKIVFSNEHSWLRSKTLKMRYVVLKPVETEHTGDKASLTSGVLKPIENIGFIGNDPAKKLDVKIVDS